MTLGTQHLFGLDFVANSSIEEVVDQLLGEPQRAGEWRCIVTPNVDHLVRYEREPEEAEAGRAATMVLPDGAPIVWASRLLRRPLARRLTGADLFDHLWPRLVSESIPTVVIASSAEVARRLSASHDSIGCVVAPMFDVDDKDQLDRIVGEADELVKKIGARLVVVGISMPKHHRVANGLRKRWATHPDGPQPTVLLLGAAPEFTLGLTKRAPAWMQRTGTEWAHRLLIDPRRMARRYLIDDPQFVRLVWREWRLPRRGSTPASR